MSKQPHSLDDAFSSTKPGFADTLPKNKETPIPQIPETTSPEVESTIQKTIKQLEEAIQTSPYYDLPKYTLIIWLFLIIESFKQHQPLHQFLKNQNTLKYLQNQPEDQENSISLPISEIPQEETSAKQISLSVEAYIKNNDFAKDWRTINSLVQENEAIPYIHYEIIKYFPLINLLEELELLDITPNTQKIPAEQIKNAIKKFHQEYQTEISQKYE